MNIKNRGIFKKTLFLFTGIFIPFLVCGGIILSLGNFHLRKQIIKDASETTDLVIENMNNELLQIYSLAGFVSSQSSVNKIGYSSHTLSEYELAYNINHIREQQTTITMSNEYVENFVIYYRQLGKAYNAGNISKPSFFRFTEEEYNELADRSTGTYQLQVYQGELCEIISVNDEVLIYISISENQLAATLSEPFAMHDFYFVLDFEDGETVITNRTGEEKGFPEWADRRGKSTVWLDGKLYYRVDRYIDFMKADFTYFIHGEELARNFGVYIFLFVGFVLSVIPALLVFAFSIRKMLFRPLDTLVRAFEKIENRDYSFRIPVEEGSDFAYIYKSYNNMAENIRQLVEKELEQQILINRAELKQMQAQINPHFLYNSFFMLKDMMQNESLEDAQKTAQSLGIYFQYITRNNQDLVPLETEYRHALIYTQIQALRFEGRILIRAAELPAGCGEWRVPKLILQPLVENAFKYGLDNKLAGGLLEIRVEGGEEETILYIEDNGEELTEEDLKEMNARLESYRVSSGQTELTGIYNIQRRLVVFSDGADYLSVSRSRLGGLCVRVCLRKTGRAAGLESGTPG